MGNHKLDGKSQRKTKRVLEKVSKEWKISAMTEPTRFILVCNAGLTTGSTYEHLLECFESYGVVEDVLLIPDKSYSFITFFDVEAASSAYKKIHGIGTLSYDNNVLYLAFINEIPKLKTNPLFIWNQGSLLWPKGLRLLSEFVTREEEAQLLDSLDWNIGESNENETIPNLKHRRVLHYGYEFSYKDNSIETTKVSKYNIKPFPDTWSLILKRAIKLNIIKEFPDQCTVNRYEPGQGIPAHIDTHSCCTETILSLSLCSDVVMNFVPPVGGTSTAFNMQGDASDSIEANNALNYSGSIPVLLPRRSLLIMSGESRYAFTHGIAIRQFDTIPTSSTNLDNSNDFYSKQGLTLMKRRLRISFTFRKTLPQGVQCICNYPAQCDSQKDKKITLDDEMANQLEKTHVHSVYEEIADHFSVTRHKPWPKVVDFLDGFKESGNILVDLGCGNGKYLGNHGNMIQLGCDYSVGLLSICRKKNFQGIRCDCLKVPFRDEIANACICIAVIHHLSTEERRRNAIQEMSRILKSDGKSKGLIYAWAKEQQKDSIPSSYLKQRSNQDFRQSLASDVSKIKKSCDTKFPLVLPVHENRTNFKNTDLLVPWKTNVRDNEDNYKPATVAESSKQDNFLLQGSEKDQSKTFHRFYHVFEEGELERLILSVSNLEIVNSYYDQGNWCVIFTKCKSN